jgi:transcriptional regulator with XRE-family HTH domain
MRISISTALLFTTGVAMVMVMDVGRRLRELRKSRRLSQGDLERRTGLLRRYASRVENGHTIANIETIEKYAIGLGVPLVAFFSKMGGPPPPELLWASENRRSRSKSKERFHIHTPAASLAALERQDRQLLVALAQRLARENE